MHISSVISLVAFESSVRMVLSISIISLTVYRLLSKISLLSSMIMLLSLILPHRMIFMHLAPISDMIIFLIDVV